MKRFKNVSLTNSMNFCQALLLFWLLACSFLTSKSILFNFFKYHFLAFRREEEKRRTESLNLRFSSNANLSLSVPVIAKISSTRDRKSPPVRIVHRRMQDRGKASGLPSSGTPIDRITRRAVRLFLYGREAVSGM